MTTETIRNGINVDKLVGTIEHIKQQPDLALFRFRAKTQWQGGGVSQTSIQGFHGAGQEDASRERPFTLVGDEPPVLLGQNAGPNAVETVLHAITSCLAVGFVYNAAAMGIEVRSLTYDVEGELDLHAFLGLSEDVRPGYSNINVKYYVDADASREKLDELCAYVQKTSPVLDMIRNPVPVNVQLAS